MGPGLRRDAESLYSAFLAVALRLHTGFDDRRGAIAGLLVHDPGLLAHDAGALPIALPRCENILIDIGIGLDRTSGEGAAILVFARRGGLIAAALGPIAGAAATRKQRQDQRGTEPGGA